MRFFSVFLEFRIPVLTPSKYALKTLQDDIALFDRKIAHLNKFENFATEQERATAAGKMASKREQLVKAAKVMTDAGIEMQPQVASRPAAQNDAAEKEPAASAVAAEATSSVPDLRLPAPAVGGTSLDFRNSILEFKSRRRLNA